MWHVTSPRQRTSNSLLRRRLLGTLVLLPFSLRAVRAEPGHPDLRWFRIAEEMKRLAESWGDQSYGAVLVLEGKAVGLGPSRVVKDGNSDAHAERVAIWQAQEKLGRSNLRGGVLYSTSRPCALCQLAAGDAEVSRMYFGPSMQDAGTPAGRKPQ